MKKMCFLIPLLVLSLTSCDFNSTGNVFIFEPTAENATIFNGYYLPNRESLRYTLRDINSQIGWVTSQSVGEQKIIVIPVEFSSKEFRWNKQMLQNVNNAFFENGYNNNFYSVKDYFYESSYHRLRIDGNVGDIFEVSYSLAEIEKFGQLAPERIIDKFISSGEINKYSEFDVDNDRLIDNIVFLYPNSYSFDDDSAFWAWCSYYEETNNILSVNNFMWASYQFLFRNVTGNLIDTHTYIHETGHLLGLDDYYAYDSNWNPSGELDMQSYNVGDHNIFSKFALGWVEPYVVTDECKITLRTSSKYPDAILIKDNWNGSAFDEYLLIEYYTPSNLNLKDALNSYEGQKMYGYSGLRIYHVDARLVELDITLRGNLIARKYVDIIPEDSYYTYFVGASNSTDRSFLPKKNASKYKLLHLLDSGYKNVFDSDTSLDPNEVLFTEKDEFVPNKNFFANEDAFNDGEKLKYKVSLSNMNSTSCEVTISKI